MSLTYVHRPTFSLAAQEDFGITARGTVSLDAILQGYESSKRSQIQILQESKVMATVPAVTVAAHTNAVKAELGNLNDAKNAISGKADQVFAALDRLRSTDLTEEQHGIADEIGTIVTDLKTDTGALISSADVISNSALTLEKAIPNTGETPFVSTGVTGNGTAAHPGTDDVREDDRRGGTL